MIEVEYRQLVRELCEEVGLEPWEQVAQSHHIDVDGVTVGLIHDEDAAPDMLALYMDFGAPKDPRVLAALLEYNATCASDSDGVGHFGLMPQEGTLVYRVDMRWDGELDGAELSSRIDRHLTNAQEALEQSYSR